MKPDPAPGAAAPAKAPGHKCRRDLQGTPAARQRRLRGVGLAALLSASALAAVAGDVPLRDAVDIDLPHSVQAPHYGDTLFHFYQDKTFAAITGLMVSQQLGRIHPHDDEAEVLRGGMLLAYGLHRDAEAVFARLIDGHASGAVRDRAWYFMARAQQQRGLPAQAEASLARIGKPLPGTLEEDRQLLLAQLLMARQDHAGAAATLDALQANPKASPMAAVYARFNLGVALIKTGDTTHATHATHGAALLAAIGQQPAGTEELRSLRDRANVALGFAALQAQQPRDARVALQRVRLNAPLSNKALLGFGWAAAELHDPQLALVPWTELAQRPGGDAAVLEARIAVPYALGELGAYGGALRGYEAAVDGFAQEAAALAESIAAIRAGRLVQGLLAANPSQGLAASDGIAVLPQMPHAAHLVPLLAGNAFQEAFKTLRDLQFLQDNLQHWQASLGVFGDMLDNRQRAFAQRLPTVRAQAPGAGSIDGLRRSREELTMELTRVQQQADAAALADAGERALLGLVQRSRATLAALDNAAANDPGAAHAAERLRRAAGALTWQLAQALPARSWAATKALRDTGAALADAARGDAALASAQLDAPARHARFAQRITALARRLDTLAPQVAALGVEQQAQLQDIAVAQLQQQQQQLAAYTVQARLAIAQIHDQAQFARRRDDGAGAR